MGNETQTFHYELYEYHPSLPAAIVAITVFAILTISHFGLLIKCRKWFCIAFAIGGIFETVGFIGRALSSQDSKARTPYIIQSLLILVAPALFAATIYMALGRLMQAVRGETYSIIRVNWMTKVFVVGDILSFFIQGGGGGIMAGGDVQKLKLGENVILGGLFLQIAMFGAFVFTSAVFHLRMRKSPTPESRNPLLEWKKILYVLYAVSALIMLRNIFRVAEYIGGRDGFLLKTEWPLYVFDAMFMAIAMVVFMCAYPTTVPSKSLEDDSEANGEVIKTEGGC